MEKTLGSLAKECDEALQTIGYLPLKEVKDKFVEAAQYVDPNNPKAKEVEGKATVADAYSMKCAIDLVIKTLDLLQSAMVNIRMEAKRLQSEGK